MSNRHLPAAAGTALIAAGFTPGDVLNTADPRFTRVCEAHRIAPGIYQTAGYVIGANRKPGTPAGKNDGTPSVVLSSSQAPARGENVPALQARLQAEPAIVAAAPDTLAQARANVAQAREALQAAEARLQAAEAAEAAQAAEATILQALRTASPDRLQAILQALKG